jgi:hypothetical protein
MIGLGKSKSRLKKQKDFEKKGRMVYSKQERWL